MGGCSGTCTSTHACAQWHAHAARASAPSVWLWSAPGLGAPTSSLHTAFGSVQPMMPAQHVQRSAGRGADAVSCFCVQGLYRTHQHRKLADFLARDFSQPSHRQAAIKNAFVLLGQHRHELGAAFFLLGGCGRRPASCAARAISGRADLSLMVGWMVHGSVGCGQPAGW